LIDRKENYSGCNACMLVARCETSGKSLPWKASYSRKGNFFAM